MFEAVLRRQDKGATPHDIALTATQLSKSSRDRALWFGKNDAEEAKEIGEAAYANATLESPSPNRTAHYHGFMKEFHAKLEDSAFR